MTPLGYIALGWHLLPIRPGTKIPMDGQGLKHATLDEDTVEGWCNKGCDWAMACAPSGCVVIDVDPRNGGTTTWQDLLARLGPLPEHPTQQTRGGGTHHVFADPGPCVGKLGPGVDVKRRGYILVAPSSGYSWTVPPGDAPELPAAWLAACLKQKPKSAPKPATRTHDSAGSAYGRAALDAECRAVASEPEGGRNNRLNVAALKLGSLAAAGELDDASAREALAAAALSNGLPAAEVAATIGSGWGTGRQAPRAAPPRPGPRACPCPALGDEPPPLDDDDCPPDVLPYSRVLRGEIPGPGDWRKGLTTRTVGSGDNERKIVEKTAGNLALLLSHEKDWCGCLSWDELGHTACWAAAPPAIPGLSTPAGALRDEHIAWVQQAARRAWGVTWGKQTVDDGMKLAARENPLHPVREYLQALEWDGEERLDTWLQVYLGAQATECPIGRWWLVSAVARVMRPACQADHVLVLQGPQGVGKSSALRAIGGEWYSGALGNLRDKDAPQSLAGVWIMEVSELDALRGKAATEIKDFISRTSDHYRPSYGHFFVDRPRTCVFAGTTNEREYLIDATGARRFWPVSVTGLRRDELAQDRDHLLAEAYRAYEDGERWWPIGQDEAAALERETEERYVADAWEDVLIPWLEDRAKMADELTMTQVLTACGVDKGQQDRASSTRAAAILRRCGWAKRHTRSGKRWTFEQCDPCDP